MTNAVIESTKEVIYLNVLKVKKSPYQPRKTFDQKNLMELAMSIKKHGLLQPISVRYVRGQYELIAGERRLRAFKMAELKYIPAIIINLTDESSAYLSLIENLQRQDLNFIEEAEGISKLITEFNLTQGELADKIGKKQSTIANKLRVLKLPEKAKMMLLENNLTERHGRALLKLEAEEDIIKVLEKVVELDLNVKKTEAYIEKYIEDSQKTVQSKNELKVKRIMKDIRLFTNTITDAVDIMKESGVPTEYEMEETEDGCMIIIDVKYKTG